MSASITEEEGTELCLKKELKVSLKKFVSKFVSIKNFDKNFKILSKAVPVASNRNFNKI